jgi:uncharacterized HAD superfamily protein
MKFFISNMLSQQPHGKLEAARQHNTQLEAARQHNLLFEAARQHNTQFMNNIKNTSTHRKHIIRNHI